MVEVVVVTLVHERENGRTVDPATLTEFSLYHDNQHITTVNS